MLQTAGSWAITPTVDYVLELLMEHLPGVDPRSANTVLPKFDNLTRLRNISLRRVIRRALHEWTGPSLGGIFGVCWHLGSLQLRCALPLRMPPCGHGAGELPVPVVAERRL